MKSALKAYDDRVSADESGIRPLYRPREWKTKGRAIEKQRKRNKWYKTRVDDTVIFIAATPKSELQRRYTEEIKASGLKIKVIEHTCISLKRLLQRSTPFKSKICEKADCLVCINGGKGPCDVHGVTYSVTCMECVNTNGQEQIYIGETSRNAYTRGKEHLASLARKEESSVLWKHSKDKHNGRIPRFCMSVMGQFKNDAMLRQVSEAVMINKEGK